jgi:hypothetical protein
MDATTGADPWTYPGHEPPLTTNGSLRPSDIPGPNAGWGEIGWFALRFNGYETIGRDAVGKLANESVEYHQAHGGIDPHFDLIQLRGCLFFEQRRYRHFGHDPDDDRKGVSGKVIHLLTPLRSHQSQRTRELALQLLLRTYESMGDVVEAAQLRSELRDIRSK